MSQSTQSTQSTQWDLGRFIKTLSYYGVVPILSSLDWFQSMFDSRPNPTLSPEAIAFGATVPAAVVVGVVPRSAIETLMRRGYRVRLLGLAPEEAAAQWGDLATSMEAIATDWTDAKLLASTVLNDAALILYGSPAEQPDDIQVDPVWQALTGAIAHLPASAANTKMVFDFSQPSSDLPEIWGALDDVVMGGVSQSGMRFVGVSAVFSGTVSTANSGGFASIRTRNFTPPLDFSGYDGVLLRVRGDGQRYKFMLRTETTWDSVAYCHSFDTRADEWLTVRIPFAELIPVFRAKTVSDAPRMDVHRVCAVQMMLSKFEYDGALNPSFEPGPFQLEMRSLQLYVNDARTDRQLIILSEAEGDRLQPLLDSLPATVNATTSRTLPAVLD